MAGLRGRGRLCAFVAAAALVAPAPVFAQDLGTLQARLDALEALVKAQAAEIQALKAAQTGAPLATAPTAAPPVVHEPVQAQEAAQVAAAPLTRPDDIPTPPAPPAVLSLPNGRPTFASADGRFDASLRTIIQVDWGSFFQDPAGPISTDLRRGAEPEDTAAARNLHNGAALRRARLGLDGQLFRDFDYNFTIELSGEDGPRLNAGWLQYSGLAPWRIRVGAFSPSDDLEGVSPKTSLPMLEQAAVIDASRGLIGGEGRFGGQIYGFGSRWFASATLTSGSVNTSAEAFEDQLGFVGRLAGRPLVWKNGFVHVGGYGGYAFQIADTGGPDTLDPRKVVRFRARPEVRLDNTRLIGTGLIEAEHAYTSGLEFALEHRNLFVQAGVVRFGAIRPETSLLSDPHFSGWYLQTGLVLTGEQHRYNIANASIAEPPVRHPFDPHAGHWGALEVAGKYSVVDLNYHAGEPGAPPPADGVRGGEQRTLTGGVNWYLNNSVRLMLGLQDVRILRLSPSGVLFLTPEGAQIGQHFQVVALRSQVAF